MRRKDREVTDIDRIERIIAKAGILHLGLFDEDYPYIVPLHYGFERKDGTFVFYLHGAKEGHKLDIIRKDNRVCIELECGVELISGGDTACKYGASFSSVIGRGRAEIVEDPAEKIHGLKQIMLAQTGRDFEIDSRMAAAAAVIKITLDSFTAKERPAPSGRR